MGCNYEFPDGDCVATTTTEMPTTTTTTTPATTTEEVITTVAPKKIEELRKEIIELEVLLSSFHVNM